MAADMNLVSLVAKYGDDEKCREALEKIRDDARSPTEIRFGRNDEFATGRFETGSKRVATAAVMRVPR